MRWIQLLTIVASVLASLVFSLRGSLAQGQTPERRLEGDDVRGVRGPVFRGDREHDRREECQSECHHL